MLIGEWQLLSCGTEPRSATSCSDRIMSLNSHVIHPTDPHGLTALLLCESVIHVLVEAGVIPKVTAMEAIKTVIELTRELADAHPNVTSHTTAAGLITGIAASFALKD